MKFFGRFLSHLNFCFYFCSDFPSFQGHLPWLDSLKVAQIQNILFYLSVCPGRAEWECGAAPEDGLRGVVPDRGCGRVCHLCVTRQEDKGSCEGIWAQGSYQLQVSSTSLSHFGGEYFLFFFVNSSQTKKLIANMTGVYVFFEGTIKFQKFWLKIFNFWKKVQLSSHDPNKIAKLLGFMRQFSLRYNWVPEQNLLSCLKISTPAEYDSGCFWEQWYFS